MWLTHLKSITDSIRDLSRDRLGASCFSAFSPDEAFQEVGIHHWAMYGGEHSGFAIEYDGKHQFFRTLAQTKWLFPVEYLPERRLVDLSEFDSWSDKQMWSVIRSWLAMKSKGAWGHEKEWRVLHTIGDSPSDHAWWYFTKGEGAKRRYYLRLWGDQHSETEKITFGAGAIRRVWLGCRSTSDLEKDVLKAINVPHLAHVEVMKLKPCDRHFRLRPVSVARLEQQS